MQSSGISGREIAKPCQRSKAFSQRRHSMQTNRFHQRALVSRFLSRLRAGRSLMTNVQRGDAGSASSWPGLSRPSTSCDPAQSQTWMPGPRPGMTTERANPTRRSEASPGAGEGAQRSKRRLGRTIGKFPGRRPPILLCMGLFSIFWVDSRGGHAAGLPGRSARPQRPDHAYRSDDNSMRNCASAIIGSVLINSMSYRARNWPSAVSLRGSLPPGFRPAARSLARRPSCCRRTRRAASRLMLLIPARRV